MFVTLAGLFFGGIKSEISILSIFSCLAIFIISLKRSMSFLSPFVTVGVSTEFLIFTSPSFAISEVLSVSDAIKNLSSPALTIIRDFRGFIFIVSSIESVLAPLATKPPFINFLYINNAKNINPDIASV